jgi:hypothetical protein
VKVKEGVKIYSSITEIREFPPLDGEFFVFIFKYKDEKEKIFVEQANKRNLGEFWSIDDAFRYAKFKKNEGAINQIFEKYERLRDQLNRVARIYLLVPCEKCKNYNHKDEVCNECGYDSSTKRTDKNIARRRSVL